MKDLVQLAIAVAFIVLVIVLGGAMLAPVIEGTLSGILTDKAELEVAKGERRAIELEAAGEYELESAAARAVLADTRLASGMVTVFIVLLALNSLGSFALIVLVLKKELRRR